MVKLDDIRIKVMESIQKCQSQYSHHKGQSNATIDYQSLKHTVAKSKSLYTISTVWMNLSFFLYNIQQYTTAASILYNTIQLLETYYKTLPSSSSSLTTSKCSASTHRHEVEEKIEKCYVIRIKCYIYACKHMIQEYQNDSHHHNSTVDQTIMKYLEQGKTLCYHLIKPPHRSSLLPSTTATTTIDLLYEVSSMYMIYGSMLIHTTHPQSQSHSHTPAYTYTYVEAFKEVLSIYHSIAEHTTLQPTHTNTTLKMYVKIFDTTEYLCTCYSMIHLYQSLTHVIDTLDTLYSAISSKEAKYLSNGDPDETHRIMNQLSERYHRMMLQYATILYEFDLLDEYQCIMKVLKNDEQHTHTKCIPINNATKQHQRKCQNMAPPSLQLSISRILQSMHDYLFDTIHHHDDMNADHTSTSSSNHIPSNDIYTHLQTVVDDFEATLSTQSTKTLKDMELLITLYYVLTTLSLHQQFYSSAHHYGLLCISKCHTVLKSFSKPSNDPSIHHMIASHQSITLSSHASVTHQTTIYHSITMMYTMLSQLVTLHEHHGSIRLARYYNEMLLDLCSGGGGSDTSSTTLLLSDMKSCGLLKYSQIAKKCGMMKVAEQYLQQIKQLQWITLPSSYNTSVGQHDTSAEKCLYSVDGTPTLLLQPNTYSDIQCTSMYGAIKHKQGVFHRALQYYHQASHDIQHHTMMVLPSCIINKMVDHAGVIQNGSDRDFQSSVWITQKIGLQLKVIDMELLHHIHQKTLSLDIVTIYEQQIDDLVKHYRALLNIKPLLNASILLMIARIHIYRYELQSHEQEVKVEHPSSQSITQTKPHPSEEGHESVPLSNSSAGVPPPSRPRLKKAKDVEKRDDSPTVKNKSSTNQKKNQNQVSEKENINVNESNNQNHHHDVGDIELKRSEATCMNPEGEYIEVKFTLPQRRRLKKSILIPTPKKSYDKSTGVKGTVMSVNGNHEIVHHQGNAVTVNSEHTGMHDKECQRASDLSAGATKDTMVPSGNQDNHPHHYHTLLSTDIQNNALYQLHNKIFMNALHSSDANSPQQSIYDAYHYAIASLHYALQCANISITKQCGHLLLNQILLATTHPHMKSGDRDLLICMLHDMCISCESRLQFIEILQEKTLNHHRTGVSQKVDLKDGDGSQKDRDQSVDAEVYDLNHVIQGLDLEDRSIGEGDANECHGEQVDNAKNRTHQHQQQHHEYKCMLDSLDYKHGIDQEYQQYQELMEHHLHPNWTVVSLSIDADHQNLILSRVAYSHTDRRHIPSLHIVPLNKTSHATTSGPNSSKSSASSTNSCVRRIQDEFTRIIESSNELNGNAKSIVRSSSEVTHGIKKEWWSKRQSLDEEMRQWLKGLEHQLLSYMKPYIMSSYADKQLNDDVKSAAQKLHNEFSSKVEISLNSIERAISDYPFMSLNEMREFLRYEWRRQIKVQRCGSNDEHAKELPSDLLHIMSALQTTAELIHVDMLRYMRNVEASSSSSSSKSNSTRRVASSRSKKSGSTKSSGDQSNDNENDNLLSMPQYLQERYQRHPLILILSPDLQRLPLESMRILRHQPVTRMPSLHILNAILRGKHSTHIDPSTGYVRGYRKESTYYLLNPQGDLQRTESMFAEKFHKQLDWSGMIHATPSAHDMIQSLEAYDIMLYCGHSGGEQIVASHKLVKSHVKSIALLMGCSSGSLVQPTMSTHQKEDKNEDDRQECPNEYDPSGIALSYLYAGSPCIVANLWDVTDGDIDKFTDEMCQRAIYPNHSRSRTTDDDHDDFQCQRENGNKHTHNTADIHIHDVDVMMNNLPSVVARSRGICKLPYLMGSAPICFGLPVYIG